MFTAPFKTGPADSKPAASSTHESISDYRQTCRPFCVATAVAVRPFHPNGSDQDTNSWPAIAAAGLFDPVGCTRSCIRAVPSSPADIVMRHPSGTATLPAHSISPIQQISPAGGRPTPGTPFKRVLLKLSGEALGTGSASGLDPTEIDIIAREVRDALSTGVQMAIVVGGGNFIRGASLAQIGHIHQATADYMGMLATIINGLALREGLRAVGVDSRVMSAIEVKAVAEPFIRLRALRHMEKRRVVILAAGTGNPFCTTDTCAALRALELDCQVILKATKVDGVYSADPRKDPHAKRFDTLTFTDAITKNLKVMDMTAFTMCQERDLPIVVFDYKTPGNIKRVVQGEQLGTLVTT